MLQIALSDDDLLTKLSKLVHSERQTSIEILDFLNEIEQRKLHVPLGYGSLYSYCTIHLGYSEGAACRRIYSARAIRSFPKVRQLLDKGELTLTTLSMIAPILTEENERFLLRQAVGRSKREIERVVARFHPESINRKDRVTPYSVIDRSAQPEMGPLEMKHDDKNHRHQGRSEFRTTFPFVQEPSIQFAVRDRFMYEFTGSEQFQRKFERARSLLSGKYPTGPTFEAVFEAALDTFLDKSCPKRREERRSARKQRRKNRIAGKKGAPQRRIRSEQNLPIPVRDQVLVRDGFRCTYTDSEGDRCSCTWDLEVHHIVPKAKGGSDSMQNLTTHCVAHNMFMAEIDFGRAHMQQFSAQQFNAHG